MMIFQELFKVFIEGLEVLQYQTELEGIKKKSEGKGRERSKTFLVFFQLLNRWQEINFFSSKIHK